MDNPLLVHQFSPPAKRTILPTLIPSPFSFLAVVEGNTGRGDHTEVDVRSDGDIVLYCISRLASRHPISGCKEQLTVCAFPKTCLAFMKER